MTSIQLNLINQSSDTNNSQIVIFGDSGPDPVPGHGAAPLLVHRVFTLPPAGGHVSFDHSGSSVTLGVAPAAVPGEVLSSPLPNPPVVLALPQAPSATILVKGGGTVPVFFVVSAGEREASGKHPSGSHGGLLGRVLSAVRGLWRMVTGDR